MKKDSRDDGRKTCFVLMPFAGESTDLYERVIKPAAEEVGFRCFRADDLVGPARIYDAIIQAIARADLLIVDASDRYPNVFYELGVAHSLGKPVVLMSRDVGSIPFDLRSFRIVIYDLREGASLLRQNLRKALTDVVSATQPQPLFGLVAELGILSQENAEALTKELFSLRAALRERDQTVRSVAFEPRNQRSGPRFYCR